MGIQEKLTTTVSTKGQVILPKEIRDTLGWKPGTRLAVEKTAKGVELKAVPIFKPTTVDEVFGSLGYTGPPVSIEEMDAAVMREARRRDRY
jgi:AbrB family looped-hinge helix DNA binding protein